MLFKSEVLTQASGSIGGVTYSHNRAGMYRRARSIPVNPNTTFQSQVRSALTQLVTRWTEILTPAQRAAWALYAANVPVIGPLGDPINISGQNWYIGANTPRQQAISKGFGALTIVDTAPTIFDRGTFTTPTVTSSLAIGTTVTVTAADAWASDDAGAMHVFEGLPQNASRNFFNGPWRMIAEIPGDSTTPPTSAIIIAAALATRGFPYAVGQKIWYAFAVARGDGRYSTRRIVESTATA